MKTDQQKDSENAKRAGTTLQQAQDVVVLDIGGTHIRIGHWRDNVPCVEFDVLDTSLLRVEYADEVLSNIIKRYVARLVLDIHAVVLGIPGMLNHDTDTITHCNNIPQLEGAGLQSRLAISLDCTVIFEQDIMLQLLGEWKSGAAQASRSVFGVYYGTGIGAAYLVNGNPKVNSAAGLQAGHIPIMAQGKLCLCGNTDCIEAYACGHTLLELAQEHDCSVEQMFAVEGNDALDAQLNTFVQYQAYLIATLTTLFVPDMILVGGGIPQMDGYPRDALLKHVHAHLQKPYPADTTKITWASLGNSSVLHGAKALLDAA